MRNFWRPVRSRPIRLFLIIMLAVPLVSLVALWAFAASITVRGAISDHTYNTSVTALTTTIEPLTIELPACQFDANGLSVSLHGGFRPVRA